jgi:hypothetical protein
MSGRNRQQYLRKTGECQVPEPILGTSAGPNRTLPSLSSRAAPVGSRKYAAWPQKESVEIRLDPFSEKQYISRR